MKFFKTIRILTVAPVMALALMTLCFVSGDVFPSWIDYCLSILFLTVLPLLAYPLQPVVPYFKGRGRDGQRDLAIVFAVIGYVAGIVYCFAVGITGALLLIYFVYLLSGAAIFSFTAFFHIKASGHSCGITGPMAVALILGKLWGLIYVPIFALVLFASIKMKRHTVSEFLLGGIMPVIIAVLLSFIIKT